MEGVRGGVAEAAAAGDGGVGEPSDVGVCAGG